MQSQRSSITHRNFNLLILGFSKVWDAINTNGISYCKPKSTQPMQAMKIGFLLVCTIGTVAVTGNQDCENPTNGANSCGQGRFFNSTEQICIPCPPFYYQDSPNHNCEGCKPCRSCEEGLISADPYGCPPDGDTRCVRADKVTDVPVTRNGELTINGATEAAPGKTKLKPMSSTPAYQETTQPLGHPEIEKITPLEYLVAGGQEMVILGENFRGDCEVHIMELVGDGTSAWNGTCPIDKSLSHRTHILCTMPPYKDEYLKQPAEVFLVITCDGGYASELMDHPITYNPVPGDHWKMRFFVLLGFFVPIVVFILFVVTVLIAVIVWWRNSKKKNNIGQHLVVHQGNGHLPQNESRDDTEMTTMLQASDHVERI